MPVIPGNLITSGSFFRLIHPEYYGPKPHNCSEHHQAFIQFHINGPGKNKHGRKNGKTQSQERKYF
jgi:hypothetical protein